MSPDPVPDVSGIDLEFSRLWAENTARVLETLHGSAFIVKQQSAEDAAAGAAAAGEGEKLWIDFKASGKLAGDQAFQFSALDGVRMAQMLMSEPVDAAVEINEGHRDALSELFRQFAGVVATACKAKYGGAVEFQLESALPPTWQPASWATWIFAAPQLAPLQWKLLISTELHAALQAANAKTAQTPAPEAAAPPSAAPPAASQPPVNPAPAAAANASAAPAANGATPNLDLLLEVELDASLRFGQREMLLREILELRPGSVVELNRQLQEPAELLVGGRIIARGEVVIVDGNYGLRITDIVHPQKRLESLST